MWLNRHAAGPGEVTTQGTCRTGSWGAEFYEVAAEPGETVITKHRYSAFVGTSLDLLDKHACGSGGISRAAGPPRPLRRPS